MNLVITLCQSPLRGCRHAVINADLVDDLHAFVTERWCLPRAVVYILSQSLVSTHDAQQPLFLTRRERRVECIATRGICCCGHGRTRRPTGSQLTSGVDDSTKATVLSSDKGDQSLYSYTRTYI